MAIVTPFSVELARDEDAIAIVEGAIPDSVAGKMKLYLGGNVNGGQSQVWAGTLRAVFRHMMNEVFKHTASSGTQAGYGDWQNASAGNITLALGSAGITDDDVAIVVSGSFETQAATHFYKETFDQLLEGLLERAKDGGTVAPPPPPP